MKLNIVIPCYNEEEVLPQTLARMKVLAGRLKAEADTEARLLLVDDGSKHLGADSPRCKGRRHGLRPETVAQ